MPSSGPEPSIVDRGLIKLYEDCERSKDRHFRARDRKRRYHRVNGIVSIVVTSIFATFIVPMPKGMWLDERSMLLFHFAFAAVILITTSAQTFLGYEKDAEGHDSAANDYVEIISHARQMALRRSSNHLSDDELLEQLESLNEKYLEANRKGQAYTTASRDYDRSRMPIQSLDEMVQGRLQTRVAATQ